MTNFHQMQFKNPEILYFLFLLVIPILVHLFQLRRFKKEYFTNVRFLKELSIQTRKSSQLKKWLLLLTRLLLLTFIILAFAQPFFKAKDRAAAGNELFILLDNSFSMQAKGQKGELLKRSVQELLENIPENQRFTLYTNEDAFTDTDIKSIQKELQNLNYSSEAFPLEQLLSRVKAKKSALGSDVVIITDGIGLQANDLKKSDSTLNTFYNIPKAEQKNNISVDSVFINQTLDNFYEIGVKLTAYGTSKTEIPLALHNKNTLIAKTLATFEEKDKTMLFTIPKEDFHGYVTIEDNGLPFDNTYYFSISKPEKFQILSIGALAKSDFLSRIYTANEFNYANFELNTLDYNQIENQETIILNELDEIPTALQSTLKSFVGKGGNLIVIPSTKINATELTQFLRSLGAISFSNIETGEKLITKIAFSHPLYSTVFEKKIENFQYPNTKSNFPILSQYAPILSYQDQQAFLTSFQNGFGKVYMFSGAINKENSNFQNTPLIVPTFYNMAQNSLLSGVVALKIGDSNVFLLDANLEKDEIISISNGTQNYIPIQQIVNNKVKISLANLPLEAGNYSILKKEQPIKNISLNFDRQESNLFENNAATLLKDQNVIPSIEAVFNTLQTDRTDQQIWKWFVMLTLLFLVIEILIQKFVK